MPPMPPGQVPAWYRDVPASCTCQWIYRVALRRFCMFEADPDCAWHVHTRPWNGATS